MADDKKPKIDLKARLGKKTVTTSGGPSIPPPVGIPKPAVPGLSSRPSQPAPRVDASDPYASISSDVATKKEPQAIKVEMSAEVVAAQRKGKLKVVALMIAAALVAGLLGFTLGDRTRANAGAYAAVAGAQELVKEVDAANIKVRELADVLKEMLNQLRDNKYPEAEVAKLGEINIPFEGANLMGKGIGRYKAKTVTLLIQFASAAQEANDAKEKLQLMMGYSKKPIKGVLEQMNEATRKVHWTLFVVNGPHGPWASMQPLTEKQQFLVTKKKDGDKAYDWPDKFKIKDGNREVELKRFKEGKCMDSDPMIIPVDPTSQSLVCSANPLKDMGVEVARLQKVLAGDNSIPGQEKQGLIDLGDLVVEELKKIGQP